MVAYLLDFFGWDLNFQTVQDLINNVVGLAVGVGSVFALFRLIFSLMRNMTKIMR